MKDIQLLELLESIKSLKEKQDINSPVDEPLKKCFLNNKVIKENEFKFNIELEDCKIYNQYTSLRCWLFATLNIIKNEIAHNLNIDKMNFELSANYLSFFDKLEKSNYVYQTIIETNIKNFKKGLINFDKNRFLADFLKEPVLENGKFEYARELIKKYGLVPIEIMPETCNSKNPSELNDLFAQKVKVDIFKLIESKKIKKNLYKIKNEMLAENYMLLSKILGEPPQSFDYKYYDINNNLVELNSITPQKFHQMFCKIDLDDFVIVGNIPITNKPFYKKFRRAYSGNIIGKSFSDYINLPFIEFQNLCITQLKNNMPVLFACDNKKYRNLESTILDTRLFDFEKYLSVNDMSKRQAIESFDINLKHFMVFRGVHIENELPIRWKVEDSAGAENRINGYYVMNQNFFEKCVFQACIHKKFLSDKQIKASNLKPIICNFRGLI